MVLGFAIPLISLLIVLGCIILFYVVRMSRLRYAAGATSLQLTAKRCSETWATGGVVMIGVPVLSSVGVAIITHYWTSAFILLLASLVITIALGSIYQKDYVLVEFFVEIIRGGILSGQAVLRDCANIRYYYIPLTVLRRHMEVG